MDVDEIPYRFQFDVDRAAGPGDELAVADVKELIRRARLFEKEFKNTQPEDPESLDMAFSQFLRALFGTGMVMKDFDGPQFDQGPFWFIGEQRFAGILRKRASLLTIRMYLHTMQRGHYFTSGMGGFPYFQEAIESGCFKALIDRLEKLNAQAVKNGQINLGNIHPQENT